MLLPVRIRTAVIQSEHTARHCSGNLHDTHSLQSRRPCMFIVGTGAGSRLRAPSRERKTSPSDCLRNPPAPSGFPAHRMGVVRDGIPVTVITDSTAAHLMRTDHRCRHCRCRTDNPRCSLQQNWHLHACGLCPPPQHSVLRCSTALDI